MIYIIAVAGKVGMGYYIVIIGFLILFWVLSDVLAIALTGGFAGKTEEQKKAYYSYAALDLIGLAGLGYFAIALNQNNGVMGAIIYAACIMFKRKYMDTYKGTAPEAVKEEPVKQPTEKRTARQVVDWSGQLEEKDTPDPGSDGEEQVDESTIDYEE